MLSALIIDPNRPVQTNSAIRAMNECLASCDRLAKAFRSKVCITCQHNIRDDHFAVIVETKHRTFGHYGPNFRAVFAKLRREIDAFLKDNHEELRSAKKQAAGEESGQRRRRKRAAGKRGHAQRQR